MKRRTWKPGACTTLAIAAFGAAVATARSQQPAPPPPPIQTTSPDDVETRLRKLEELNEKLEKQNQKLADQNAKLEKLNQQLQVTVPAAASDPSAPAAPPTPVQPEEVKKLVDGYLKEKEAAKIAADEEKQAQQEADGYEVGSDLNLKAMWRDGFFAETANKDFQIHIGGKLQNDYGWFMPDKNLAAAFPTGTPAAPGPGPNAWNDGSDLRRARFRMDGTLWETIDFVFEYEFAQTQQVTSSAGSATTISATGPTDAYIDVKDLPYVGRLRLGHFKEPFSLEDYGTQDVNLTFLERSSANDAFSPNRNFGAMLWNDPFDQHVVYGLGLFKENTNTNIGNAFDYGTGSAAYTGRLGFNPWYDNNGACVFFFGGAYSYRIYDDSSALDRYRYATRIPIRVGSPIILDTTSLVAQDSELFNAQAALVLGPFSLQAEGYAEQGIGLQRGLLAPGVARLTYPELNGAYVQATLFLTGEHRNYIREVGGFGKIRPLEPFYFVPRGGPGGGLGNCFGRGAWELAARLDYLDLDSAAFASFAGVKGVSGSSVAAIPTVGFERDILFGLNWYLNPNVKMQWNYVHAVRDVAVPSMSGDVDAFAMRLTLDF
ncbi:MAG TPA: porin [Gemmataceae bacterium]|nr:porin [Gemmataceae bacterium]